MKFNFKTIIIIFGLVFFMMVNIWEKYKSTAITYEIQDLIKKINVLEEKKKTIMLMKLRLESSRRIQQIAEQKLQMMDIKDRDMIVVQVRQKKT